MCMCEGERKKKGHLLTRLFIKAWGTSPWTILCASLLIWNENKSYKSRSICWQEILHKQHSFQYTIYKEIRSPTELRLVFPFDTCSTGNQINANGYPNNIPTRRMKCKYITSNLQKSNQDFLRPYLFKRNSVQGETMHLPFWNSSFSNTRFTDKHRIILCSSR